MNEIRLQSPISVLRLKTKPRNALHGLGISTIGEFLLLDVLQVAKLRGVGQGTVAILRRIQEELLHLLNTSKGNSDSIISNYAELWKYLKKLLSVRTENGLTALSINSLGDFMALDRETFLSLRSIGQKSWKEVKHLQERIAQLGFPVLDNLFLPKSSSENQFAQLDDKAALEIVRKSLRGRAHLLEDLNIATFSQLKTITQDDVFAIPGAGRVAWEKLQDAIILADKACTYKFSIQYYTRLEDFPLWNGHIKVNVNIPEEFFPNQRINNIVNTIRCKKALHFLGLKTIGDVLLKIPEDFLELSNFGISSLDALRLDIQSYIEYQSQFKKGIWCTNSFSDFLFILCENAGISEKHALMVIKKLTGKNNRPCTLDEIAAQYNCTRERVRQIIQNAFAKINKTYKNRYAFERFRIILKDLTIASGGIINIDEAIPYIADEMNWKTRVSSSAFIEFMKHIPIGHSLNQNKQCFSIQYPCRHCDSLSSKFKLMVENDYNGQMPFVQLADYIVCLCIPDIKKSCPQNIPRFSRAFWIEHAERLNFRFDNINIYTEKMWQLFKGGLQKKVEATLYASKVSMTPEKVAYNLYSKLRKNFNTKKIHAALISSSECVVWGRGEFIHSSCITFSDAIIDYISMILANKLSTVPFIASKGIYDEFCKTFKESGIPNEYALSSVINLQLEKFYVDRYHYIYAEKPENATSIDDHIEQWVLDAGEAIKRCDLEKWLTEEIGTRKSLVNPALNRINAIIPAKKGWLVHIDNLEIDKNSLMPLCKYINKELNRYTQLGVNKVLKNNQVYLAHLKIQNARMFYAILQHFFSDIYNFPRFPHISLLGQDISVSLSQGLSNYVQKKECIISIEECVDYFEKKGYPATQTRARIGGLPELLEYYPRCIIHKQTLGWNSEKNHVLRNILTEAFNDRISSGQLSGDLDEVFDMYEEQLPSLDNGISWTGRLLASVVGKMNEIKLLGNAKRAYLISGHPSCPFSNLGDIVCYVVRNHFSGGCSRADLNQWMIDNGIVKKQLTTQMFTPPHGLFFSQYECYWEGK